MYTFEGRVRYSECDERGDLSLINMINYLQDCAIFHSENIGRGVKFMTERGTAWLIAAWQIEIERLPHFGEDIRVSTWCPSMSRSIVSRQYTIRDAEDTVLVRANSQWFIYDFVNGRAIRVPDIHKVFVTDDTPLDMPPMERRLRMSGAYAEAPAIIASDLHLDTNRHVNNAQYLGMATNAMADVLGAEGTIRASEIGCIKVQYRRQALLGDTIIPQVHAEDTACTVNLVNPEGETYAVVRFERR